MLGFVQGAYSTEVLRGAILAVPQGQIEAARAYGMSPGLLLRRITLPAMLPFAIPGLANLWLIATKDTALLAVVGFSELTLETRQAAGATKAYFTFYVAAGALYLHADAVLQRHHRAHRALGAARHAVRGRERADGHDEFVLNTTTRQRVLGWLQPHRIVLIAIALADRRLRRHASCAGTGCRTMPIWRCKASGARSGCSSSPAALGFALAVPLGLWQAAGPRWLGIPAKIFCTIIRGTPLLLQLWLLYYGLGSLFPQFPWIRESFLWPYLRQAWPYAVLSLTLSYAGYEGEVMRGAFAGVPRGQLEAARAFGMSRWKVFRRIWLPQAVPSRAADAGRRDRAAIEGDAAGGDDHHGRHLCRRLAGAAGNLHRLRAAAAAGAGLSGDHRHPRADLPQAGVAHPANR